MPVECVKKLSAELGMHSFRDCEGLGQAEILVVEGERSYVRRVTGHISEYVGNVNPRTRVRIRKKAAVPVSGSACPRSRVVPGGTGVAELNVPGRRTT